MTDLPLDWLLDSDPTLVWQVERDLAGATSDVWQATRSRIATEGFGAKMLALQDDDGQWAGGAYFPGDFRGGEPQPWTATTWALNFLRDWGLDAAVLAGTAEQLAANSRWDYEDLPYWGGEVDACINGYTLANGAWLGADVAPLLGWFADKQMADGGWNCDWVEGSVVSSFPSTLNSLNALRYYETATGKTTWELRKPAEEYLLERGLYRRKSTGEPVGHWVFDFEYPFRWFYSVLHAAEYFRLASQLDGTPPDPRMADAIDAVRERRRPDGRWAPSQKHQGRMWFEVDVPAGEPSRWLTLHATRVLRWWDSAGE